MSANSADPRPQKVLVSEAQLQYEYAGRYNGGYQVFAQPSTLTVWATGYLEMTGKEANSHLSFSLSGNPLIPLLHPPPSHTCWFIYFLNVGCETA